MININLYDPSAIMNVLGCLIQNCSLLAMTDKYKIELDDFDDKFTKAIFMAINNLYKNGANKIGVLEIAAYLCQNPAVSSIFKDNKGEDYLSDAETIASPENFDYYYTRMKKFSALRKLQHCGYGINKIYDDKVIDPKRSREMMVKFDSYSIKEIFDMVIEDFAKLEAEFVGSMSGSSGDMSDGMDELKAQLDLTPEIGFPLQGEVFNTVVRGARRRKLYLRSGSTGSGKTRLMLGDACNLAYPTRYDSTLKDWIITGNNEKVLFITTENELEELQTIVWSYLSGVNEEKILYHSYEGDEEERIIKAKDICKQYRGSFYWEHIPDPTIDTVAARMKKQVRSNKVEHVFYDYIFSSPSLIREFEGFGLREDVVLLMLATKLKDLANELNIFVMTGTQLNGGWEDSPKSGIRNQNIIRGSKAIADKVDVGVITLPVMAEEMETLSKVTAGMGGIKPTHVTDVYKLRRGRYKNVRIWSKIDLGTGRMKDLFVTDANFNVIKIDVIKYNFDTLGKEW